MEAMYYIGLDVHKQKISYGVKDGSGKLHAEGSIPATRHDLDYWMKNLPQPWSAAHPVHGLDLRSSEATRRCVEGRSPRDATSDCRGEKEERSH